MVMNLEAKFLQKFVKKRDMNRITISPLKIPAIEFGSSKESKRGLICIQEWW